MRRLLLIIILCLMGCAPSKPDLTESVKVESLSWGSGYTGIINEVYKFHLLEHRAAIAQNVNCDALRKSDIKASAIMTLLTQDTLTVKIEKVGDKNTLGEYGIVLSQNGYDVGDLGVSWGHLKLLDKNTEVIDLPCSDEP